MPEGQVEGNSATAVAEPASSGQSAPVSNETHSQNGQATTQVQSAPAEESFSNIDPKTLSPELQSVYKQLQADYTKKTMSVADIKKKAEAFDQVRSRSDFNDWWSGATKQQKAEYKEQKAEVEKTLGQKITDEEFTKGFQSKDDFLSLIQRVVSDTSDKAQKKIDTLEQKLSVKESQDLTNSFATEQGPDGKILRPDFDELEEHNLISGFLAVNQPEDGSAQAQLTRLNEAYAWAKAVSGKFYEKGKADALQIIQKKAASSTQPPTNAAKGTWTGGDPKKMSVRELMDFAKKGIRVPRDD